MPLLHVASFDPQACEVETLRRFSRHEFISTQLIGVGTRGNEWVGSNKTTNFEILRF